MAAALGSSPIAIESRKRKLVDPPVKVACLSCRASRTRCDGRAVCSSCVSRNKSCSYKKSNRGGPRVSRKKSSAFQDQLEEQLRDVRQEQQRRDSFTSEPVFDRDVPSMILPGAGLTMLDSDQMFDSLFGPRSNSQDLPGQFQLHLGLDSQSPTPLPLVRAYGSNEAILNAYYTFLHSYFPILPPSTSRLSPDCPLTIDATDFEPSSPISLALCAILTLIPHPDDPMPRSQDSILLRRQRAHLFATFAMESIEIEAEVLDSAISPADALSSNPSTFSRLPFHPTVPVEIESVLAYLVLSIYEYAQRGNLAKMRNRASQAYDAAIRLSLNESSDISVHGECVEARRRAWWMTYICVLQSSIVSSTAPIIPVEYRQFQAQVPTIESDREAWPAYLDAQQLILKCTQFTVALKKTLQKSGDMDPLDARLAVLDSEIDALSARYNWPTEVCDPAADSGEEVLARSLKCQAQIKFNSARIKLHRYRAFLDVPIFTRKHCDLAPTADTATSQLSCCMTRDSSVPESEGAGELSSSSSSAASLLSLDEMQTGPFSDAVAAKVCMKAALAISRAFEALPYPNPAQVEYNALPTFLSRESFTFAPRMMPAFACCAMQSSYALLMLCRKSQDWNPHAAFDPMFMSGLEELYAGIQRVLGALQNYSIAWEALGGMRSQIQEVFDTLRQNQTPQKIIIPSWQGTLDAECLSLGWLTR